jgi:heme/copper-type cytochrome/quinol oxidase subunit 2
MPKTSPEQIIREIESRKVVPIPRWRFMLRRALFWVLALVSVVTGAISMATAIYIFFDNDYITDHANIEKLFVQRPLVEVIVQSIPYVWLIALTLFVVTAYYSFRHTRRGYRYPVFRVIAGSLLLSVLLGAILDVLGTGMYIHRYLIENVRGYDRLVYTNEILWNQMDKGLLGGKVVRYSRHDSLVVIRDYRHRVWNVDISRAHLHSGTRIHAGKYLKITGLKTGPSSFRAATIRPWVRKFRKKELNGKKHQPVFTAPPAASPALPYTRQQP